MFKKITVAIVTVCLAFLSMYAASPIVKVQSNVPTVKKEVSDVPQKAVANDKTDKSTSRFLNMLNHNYVYGEDFDDLKTIVNNSCAALIDRIDDDGYINAYYVENYLKNMYDISVDDIDKINDVWILMDTCDEVDWTESTPYKAFSSKESAIKGIIDAIHEKESMVDDDEIFSDEECQEFAENIIDSCQDPLKMEFDWDNNSCTGFECLTVVHLPLIK